MDAQNAHTLRAGAVLRLSIWLNLQRSVFPSAPASSFFAIGAGSSITWVDPERQMVVVVRWIDADHADAFFGAVGEAMDARA